MTRDDDEPVGADATGRLLWALRRAELAVRALKEQRLRPLGMAPAHYSLLMLVHTEPGLTGAELARRLDVTPQAVASLVTRLVDKGQLERRSHPRHRHVQELHLTDAGRQALKSADAMIVSIEHQIIERIGPDSAAQFTAMLGEVIDAARDTKS
ncbi:MarR family winged helix-turn-helix transcriptional regulator [Nonomuraea jabiensis]|uniref:DNA-binding MarR family transcriptional regulator n=1 Tax=Nonomuraea jabiensis TaxID=882448 RepID=A0A7W9GFQ3_9ACTN|nr:MarR family transcriptional regulator [Nonomuraea jabiensis]MBB5782990.1 DNA-binding MarR family transcriptional regulator [Nonomuraea jabiensis]